MPLIKEGAVAKERWRRLADDEPLPDDGAVLVSLERWQRDERALLAHAGPLGVRLKAGQHPEAIAAHVGRLALVALEFPKFTDGRAYSYARLLRERYGYKGELRAVGQVLRDQLLFMHRCGFDAYEIARADAAEAWRKALAEISVFYQPMGDGRAHALFPRPSRPRGGGRVAERATPRSATRKAAPGYRSESAIACSEPAPSGG